MNYSVKNQYMEISADTLGAQLMSIRADGREYLWQGDAKYWSDRSPLLFPFIGRLWNKQYAFGGNTYSLPIHGFAASLEFTAQVSDSALTMVLESSEETLKYYPFPFLLTVTFALEGKTLHVRHTVRNTGANTMYFGLGGHPGIRVPLEDGEHFEDYTLEFSAPCFPERIEFTEEVLFSGNATPYPLEKHKKIRLQHSLFDNDAIILQNTARQVTLSGPDGHGVTMDFADFPYFGIWHRPQTDAPYVCLEPWTSLPGRQDIMEDLSCRSDLIALTPGREYQAAWSLTL